MSTVDYVLEYVKAQIESLKKTIAEVEEIIRLGELMKIDVSEQKMRLAELKKRLEDYEAGYNKYLASRSIKAK